MALSARQKKGIGFMVSGVIFFTIGVMTLMWHDLPAWMPTAFLMVSTISGVLGIAVTLPEV